jgi:hypothetical protein
MYRSGNHSTKVTAMAIRKNSHRGEDEIRTTNNGDDSP